MLVHMAAETGSLELLRHLIEQEKFEFNTLNDKKFFPIECAFVFGKWDCVSREISVKIKSQQRSNICLIWILHKCLKII